VTEPTNELAVRYDDQAPEVYQPAAPAKTDTDSWIEVARPIIHLADQIANTEFVPKALRDNPAAVAAAMLYGREVGLPPLTALNQTHVIEGKPALSAEAMRGLVLGAGHQIEVTETTGAVCTMRGRRRDSGVWTTVRWTIDMARAAGIASKAVWKSYPRAMLQARATAELCRLVFPDVIHGFVAVEEFDGDEARGEGGGKSTVQRKRSTGRKTAPQRQPESAPEPAAIDGPPLPDEGPTETTPAPGATAEGHDGEESARSGLSGSSPSPDPSPAPGVGAPAEPHDAVATPADEASAGEDRPDNRKATRAQQRMLFAGLNRLGVPEDDDGAERRRIAGRLLGRDVESFADLTRTEVTALIDTLAKFADREALWQFLDNLDQPTLDGEDGDQ